MTWHEALALCHIIGTGVFVAVAGSRTAKYLEDSPAVRLTLAISAGVWMTALAAQHLPPIIRWIV